MRIPGAPVRSERGTDTPQSRAPTTPSAPTLAPPRVRCHPGPVQTVYDAAGGEATLLRLASAWHARVLADEVVAHAFHGGARADHTERLAAYWAESLGGPTAYTGRYGDETSVVRMHSGNGEHDEMDRRAVACFDEAMTDIGLAQDDPVRGALHDYFAWTTTTVMSRYPASSEDVPDGLRITHWSWNGPQE
jgi:hemoglobin